LIRLMYDLEQIVQFFTSIISHLIFYMGWGEE
jgi:hypothetical protein